MQAPPNQVSLRIPSTGVKIARITLMGHIWYELTSPLPFMILACTWMADVMLSILEGQTCIDYIIGLQKYEVSTGKVAGIYRQMASRCAEIVSKILIIAIVQIHLEDNDPQLLFMVPIAWPLIDALYIYGERLSRTPFEHLFGIVTVCKPAVPIRDGQQVLFASEERFWYW